MPFFIQCATEPTHIGRPSRPASSQTRIQDRGSNPRPKYATPTINNCARSVPRLTTRDHGTRATSTLTGLRIGHRCVA
jgi:hypothetical protein